MKRNAQLIAGCIGAAAIFALPGLASGAENVSIVTNQVLPQGGGALCAQPIVSDIRTYIYGDGLNSFDFTISDPAYVALAGSVGSTGIPFHLMTRDIDNTGRLRIHVDVPLSAERGAIPVSVVLLSGTGQAVCITTVSFTVSVGQMQNVAPYIPPAVTPSTSGSVSSGGTVATSTPTEGSGTSSATSSTDTVSVGGSLGTFFGSLCTGGQGAFELWFVLLALFLVLVAFASLAEVLLFERYPYLPIGIIVVPLLVLLAFWYFATACRTEGWAPVALIIIAVIGLVIAFRNSQTPRIVQLPPARK
jgi:hypothetical protein